MFWENMVCRYGVHVWCAGMVCRYGHFPPVPSHNQLCAFMNVAKSFEFPPKKVTSLIAGRETVCAWLFVPDCLCLTVCAWSWLILLIIASQASRPDVTKLVQQICLQIFLQIFINVIFLFSHNCVMQKENFIWKSIYLPKEESPGSPAVENSCIYLSTYLFICNLKLLYEAKIILVIRENEGSAISGSSSSSRGSSSLEVSESRQSLIPAGIITPDRQSLSRSLYQLSYPDTQYQQ
jgi:hypothetical protein